MAEKCYLDPWKGYAERYEKLYWAPGKPTADDMRILNMFMRDVINKNRLGKVKILILGATPAVRDEIAKFDCEITIIDATKEMIGEMTRLTTHKKKETFVEGDWLKMQFPDEEFDFVVGDLVLGNIHGEGKDLFLREVNRVIKPGGYWITRVYYFPINWKKLTTEEVFEKFSALEYDINKSMELFMFLLYNTYDAEKHEVYTSMIKEELSKYWKDGKYSYPEDKKIEKLLNSQYEMWKPFEKTWHTGTKEEVYSWISEYFEIVGEGYAKDHILKEGFVTVCCRKK